MFLPALEGYASERCIFAASDTIRKMRAVPTTPENTPRAFLRQFVSMLQFHRSREVRQAYFKLLGHLVENGIIPALALQQHYFASVIETMYLEAGTWSDTTEGFAVDRGLDAACDSDDEEDISPALVMPDGSMTASSPQLRGSHGMSLSLPKQLIQAVGMTDISKRVSADLSQLTLGGSHSSPRSYASLPTVDPSTQHRVFQFARKLGQVFATTDIKTLLSERRNDPTGTGDVTSSPEVQSAITSPAFKMSPKSPRVGTRGGLHPNAYYVSMLHVLELSSPIPVPALTLLLAKEASCESLPNDVRDHIFRVLLRNPFTGSIPAIWTGIQPRAQEVTLYCMAKYLEGTNGAHHASCALPIIFHALRALSESFSPDSMEDVGLLHQTLCCVCIVLRYVEFMPPLAQRAMETFIAEILANQQHGMTCLLKHHTTLLLQDVQYLRDVLQPGDIIPPNAEFMEMGSEFRIGFKYSYWDQMMSQPKALTRGTHISAVLQYYVLLRYVAPFNTFDFLVNPYHGVLLNTLGVGKGKVSNVQNHALQLLIHLVFHPSSYLVKDPAYIRSTIRHLYLSFLAVYCNNRLRLDSVPFCCLCAKALTQLALCGGETARDTFLKLNAVNTLSNETQLEHYSILESLRSNFSMSGTTTSSVLPGVAVPGLPLCGSDTEMRAQSPPVIPALHELPSTSRTQPTSLLPKQGSVKFVVPKLNLALAPPTAYYTSHTDESIREAPLSSSTSGSVVLADQSRPTSVFDDIRSLSSLNMSTREISPSFYDNFRKKVKLYTDANMHSHIVFLLLSLLIGRGEEFDERVCEAVHGMKANVLYILHRHINHPQNQKYLVPKLLSVAHLCGRPGVWIATKILCSVGPTLEAFTLREKIGSGAFATVFACTDKILGRSLALKQIAVPTQIERRNTFVDVHNEVLRLHSFRHHHNISQIVDFGSTDGYFYIICERYGQTLRGWRASQPCITEDVVLRTFYSALQAVTLLHDRSIAHCDIKGENFFLRPVGFGVVLGDLADCVTEVPGRIFVKGTECIRSPEVLALHKHNKVEDRRATHTLTQTSCDVWALGLLLYEIAIGDYLFDSNDYGCFVHRLSEENEPLLSNEQEAKLRDLPNVRTLLLYILSRSAARRPNVGELRARCRELCPAVEVMMSVAQTLPVASQIKYNESASPPPRVQASCFGIIVARSKETLVLCHNTHQGLAATVVAHGTTHFVRLLKDTMDKADDDNATVDAMVSTHPCADIFDILNEETLQKALTFLQSASMEGYRVGIAAPSPYHASLLAIAHLVHAHALTPSEAVVEICHVVPNSQHGLLGPNAVAATEVLVRMLSLVLSLTSRAAATSCPATGRGARPGLRCACGQSRIEGRSHYGPTTSRGDGGVLCGLCKYPLQGGRAWAVRTLETCPVAASLSSSSASLRGKGLSWVENCVNGPTDLRPMLFYGTI